MFTIRYAFRTLFKSPFVTAIAIISLALGIGANAAIYSLFDQMLLRSLPVAEPAQLVNLVAPGPKPGSTSCNQSGDCEHTFSYPMFRDLEKAQTVFTALAAHRTFGANLAFRDQTLNGQGVFVSGSYFPVLGVTPTLGRLLTPADDQAIGAHPVAVLSHAFWESRLGSDPAIVGQTIVVNGSSLTIIGVGPKGFLGTTLGTQPRLFVPLTMRVALSPGSTFKFENRRDYQFYLFGRLKPGMSLAQARVAMNTLYRPILTDVEAPMQEDISAATLAKFKAKELGLEDGRRGQSSIHGEARMPLILLMAVTAIVLLIACANIANLLLARAANRELEMAVRLSLGAGRAQLLRQLLTESLLLAVMGGAVSLLVARGTLGFIASILPSEGLATLQLTIRPVVVVFAAGLSIFTGLLFGLFPALHSTRSDLVTSIRSNAGNLSAARSATRFRTTLVTAQIALSMALLISAGLFIRSLTNISRVDLGLTTDGIVTFAISPSLSGYTPARRQALFTRVEEELAAIPGVTHVAVGRVPLLSGDSWGSDVLVEGFQRDPDTDAGSRTNSTGPGYFAMLGIPLLAGREFSIADAGNSPKVAIVNEAFAKKFNLGRDAVGKRVGFGYRKELDMEIVGLVKDAKYNDVKDEIPPQIFTAYKQDSTIGGVHFYAKTSLEAGQLLRSIPAVMARIDPNLPVEDLKTLPQQVAENVFLDRMISTLAVAFATLATLLAAVGLYGVLAFTVAQRTREIGVRMALGANAGRVRLMVLRQVAVMTLVGGVIGIAAALGLGRGARSLLYGLEGHDPIAIVMAAAVLTLVALGAGYLPARRASRVHPMRALRYE